MAFKIGNQTVLDIDVGGGTKIESATDKDVVLYPGTGGEIYIGSDTSLTFEGSSPPDEFEGRLKATTLTADREYTLPDHAYLDGAVSQGMIAVLDVTEFPTGDIATYVDAEIARAGIAEVANTTAISDEATTARAAELLLTNNLAAEITRAGLAEDANTLAITNLSVSSGNAFAAADVVVTDAFIAADVVVTDAYIAADVVVTDAYIAADTAQTTALQTYADTAEADAVATAAADATAKANTAKSEAISEVTNGAGAAFDTLVEIQNAMATDAELSTAITNVTSAAASTAAADATTKADAAVVTANAYTDTAITNNVDFTGYAQESYVDTAEADAITSAEAKDVVRASAAATDATTKADAALASAEAKDVVRASAAATDATTKADAALASAEAKDVVRASAAATDATTKADAALASAEAKDVVRASAAATDATTKADAALASALAADANTTYTAGNGLTLTGTEFTMSGAYTGNFTATGDVTAYSDIRFKHNVKTITNAVDTVNNLRGVMFHKDNRNSTGVIAQEVEAVFPEVVHTNPEGLKSVAYGNIVGLLIEAVKEQQIQITSLKEEINNLKK